MSLRRNMVVLTAVGLSLVAVAGSALALTGKRVTAPRRAGFQSTQTADALPPPPPVDPPGTVRPLTGRAPMKLLSEIRPRGPLILEPNEIRPRYQGTIIAPYKDATGHALALQKQAAFLIGRADFKPAARLAHFRWLEDYPITLRGWLGEIEETRETADGLMARVRVWPKFDLAGKRLAIEDRFYETYLYANGRVTLVSTEDPGPNPGFYLY